MLIIALQFRLIEFFEINLNNKNNIFSEIKIKLKENDGNQTEEFSIFGRRLALGSGDYFLDIPYALGTQRFEVRNFINLLLGVSLSGGVA